MYADEPGTGSCLAKEGLRLMDTHSVPAARQKHPDLVAIPAILLTELRDEVALLEPDADEDVPGSGDREQQMTGGHDGRRPETEQKAEIDGMAHVAVEERRPEFRLGDFVTSQAREYLAHTEELEMVDEEGAHQEHRPPEPEHGPEQPRADGALDAPDDRLG